VINRRSLITGLISLVAAPAIVRAGSLMPVRQMLEPEWMAIDYGGFVINLPAEYHALLKGRIDASYEMIRKSITENMERDLYHSTGPDPLNGLFEHISPKLRRSVGG
jgi:hypothetical protein